MLEVERAGIVTGLRCAIVRLTGFGCDISVPWASDQLSSQKGSSLI
jgi:hypothetical protein